jgi:integrase
LRFLDYVYGRKTERGGHATEEQFAEYERLAVQYLEEDRDNAADLVGFIRHMADEGVPPRTINNNQCGARQWLIDNDIEFSEKDKQRLRRVKPKGGRRTNIKYADIQTVRDIVAQGDVRLTALVLVLACTGMRIGEALNLRWSQVRFPDRTKPENTNRLAEIFIIDSKNQTSRRIWMTREAEDALLAWKAAIPIYLASVELKSTNMGLIRKRDRDFVFPFGNRAVYIMWDRACKTAGYYQLDEKTRRTQLNIHRLRGFFKTQTMPIIGSEMSELLMGHSDAYGNAYNGLPDDRLEQEYRKCEAALTIAAPHGFERVLEQQTQELDAVKTQMDEMRRIITRLTVIDGMNVKRIGDEITVDILDKNKVRTVNRVRIGEGQENR